MTRRPDTRPQEAATAEEALDVEHETVAAEAAWLDREPDEVWEPWKPQIGQRVALAPQPECDAYDSTLPYAGCTGVVEHINDPSEADDGHRFWVRMDDPSAREHFWQGSARMAASELVPLAPERRDGGEALAALGADGAEGERG